MPTADRRQLLEVLQGVDPHCLVGTCCCDDGEVGVRCRQPGAGVAGRLERREGFQFLRRHRDVLFFVVGEELGLGLEVGWEKVFKH